MTNSAALLAGASADAVFGLIAVGLIAHASVRGRDGVRIAYGWMALGFGLGATSLGATAIWVALAGVGTAPLVPFACGLTAQAVVLLVAVLRLATIVDGPGTAVRRCVEGLVLASSGVYALWMLAIEPFPIHYLGHRLDLGGKTIGLLILAPSAIALSTCATVLWRVRSREPGPLVATILGVVAASAFLLLAVAFVPAGGGIGIVEVAAILYLAGIIAATVRVRHADRPVAARMPVNGSGTLIGWMPVSLAIAACVIHLAIYHRADNTSILIATVIGAALGGRQTVAMRDLRASAVELARREALYKALAHTDPLTDLANRRALVQILTDQVIDGPPSVLLAIDLDGFKNINDLRGHDAGDAVLIEVAHRLRSNLRPDDIAARLGGDEFAVVLWLQPDEALATADRLRAVLARPYHFGDGSNGGGTCVFLSASVGLAPCAGVPDVAGLMRNADLALRFAKLRGKDRVESYAEAFVAWLRRRTTIEAELRGAIGRSELSVVYQPVVGLPAGTVVGAEALLRWHHPALGTVPPTEFIPIAADTGLIDELGRWMMAESCRQLARWIVEGLHLWLSVNISIRELRRPDYVAQVKDIIRTHRLPSERLVLEISEHAVAVESDELMAGLAGLRAIGVRIALDDFGAGYSSLGRLRWLPVDILKMDAAIIATAAEPGGHDAGPLADVVVRLGQRLGLDVIAEGIADAEQHGIVAEAGCVLVQGEFVGSPMPAEHLEARLAADAASHVPMPRRSHATRVE